VITCTNSSTDKDWIWVGKKAASNEVIMCGAVDSAGPYEMIGQEPIGTSTTLRVRGSASFAEAIKFMRVGGVIDACSFDPVAGNLLPSQTIEGGANYYDFIYGSDGNDTLKGEYVMGYGGVDNISIESNMPAIEYAYGGNGNDTIWGNAGNEELYGQNNNDIIHGSGGNDLLRGGPGNDTLYGEADNDTIYGDGPDPGNDNGDIDTLLGGTGSDILYGQYGSDFLDPQGGGTNEICDGGSNNNTPGDGCCPTDCDALINCEYSWSL
jgi:Ca2+-binding RTX toxin-like protein